MGFKRSYVNSALAAGKLTVVQIILRLLELLQICVSVLHTISLAPTIEFEETAYQVREPPGPEGLAILNIKVLRRGDQNRTSKVRCSTRDGSAQSGVDYYPKSRVLKFSPGKGYLELNYEVEGLLSDI